jgi:hypothetical protein
MLFRRPKLIKVDVTKTRRNRDGHFAGEQQTVPCRPAFVRACWRIEQRSVSFVEEFVDLLDLLRQSLDFGFGRLMHVFRHRSIPLIF